MKFLIRCGTWIKNDDSKILSVLKESDIWPSVQELSELTGLPVHRVESSLKKICALTIFGEKRIEEHKKRINDFLED